MNSRQPSEESGRSRISNSTVIVMLIIVAVLALLAVFANIQRSRREQVETVVVRPATTPAPQAR